MAGLPMDSNGQSIQVFTPDRDKVLIVELNAGNSFSFVRDVKQEKDRAFAIRPTKQISYYMNGNTTYFPIDANLFLVFGIDAKIDTIKFVGVEDTTLYLMFM